MTVTLDIKPETERRLRRKAEQEGQDITTYLEAIMERVSQDTSVENVTGAAQAEKNKAALEVMRRWREQNATDDPKILEQRNLDWEELKQALNESHTSDRVLFP